MPPIERTVTAYDGSKQLVSNRHQTILGEDVAPGEKLPMEDMAAGVGMRLWMTGRAEYEDDYRPTPELRDPAGHGSNATPGVEGDDTWMAEADGVLVEAGDNGWYTIHAAWLGEEGEKVHGLEAAQARTTEVRETGDTKGFSYAHTGGGWYAITGPGLEEPLKVKGEDGAKTKVTELRAAAPPTGGTGGGGTSTGE